MAGKVYKFWRTTNINEAWYRLSEKERDDHLAEVHAAVIQVGGKNRYMSRSAWAKNSWEYSGLQEFPDVEALMKHRELQDELDHFRYFDDESWLAASYP